MDVENESRKWRQGRNLGAVRTESSNWGKLPADKPSAGQTLNPKEQHYGLWDQQNKQRYEEYGGRSYSYNPYQDYSDGRIQNNMRQRPQLKSEAYRPCRNFAQQENQRPRKPPCLFREKEGNKQNIHQLHGLISRKPIGHKRAPIEGKISKLLAYGDQQMPETQVRLCEIRSALGEFAHQQKDGRKFEQKNYLRKWIWSSCRWLEVDGGFWLSLTRNGRFRRFRFRRFRFRK